MPRSKSSRRNKNDENVDVTKLIDDPDKLRRKMKKIYFKKSDGYEIEYSKSMDDILKEMSENILKGRITKKEMRKLKNIEQKRLHFIAMAEQKSYYPHPTDFYVSTSPPPYLFLHIPPDNDSSSNLMFVHEVKIARRRARKEIKADNLPKWKIPEIDQDFPLPPFYHYTEKFQERVLRHMENSLDAIMNEYLCSDNVPLSKGKLKGNICRDYGQLEREYNRIKKEATCTYKGRKLYQPFGWRDNF